MKLLVVEDEPKTAAFLRKGFTEQGFVVDSIHDGIDGLHMAMTEQYDCIILDVLLPGLDGWSIISEIRRRNPELPIIFLTARDGIHDRVKGLELGADDYLVKPFAFSELLARVRTILRRGTTRRQDTLSFQDLTLDIHRHTASRGDQRLDLTPQEFRLLHFFLRHPHEVLSRTLISEQVWDMHFDSDTNVVDVAIRRLRHKVDNPFKVKLIHTIRGVGYVLGER